MGMHLALSSPGPSCKGMLVHNDFTSNATKVALGGDFGFRQLLKEVPGIKDEGTMCLGECLAHPV